MRERNRQKNYLQKSEGWNNSASSFYFKHSQISKKSIRRSVVALAFLFAIAILVAIMQTSGSPPTPSLQLKSSAVTKPKAAASNTIPQTTTSPNTAPPTTNATTQGSTSNTSSTTVTVNGQTVTVPANGKADETVGGGNVHIDNYSNSSGNTSSSSVNVNYHN